VSFYEEHAHPLLGKVVSSFFLFVCFSRFMYAWSFCLLLPLCYGLVR
jgi:hypothetical protein